MLSYSSTKPLQPSNPPQHSGQRPDKGARDSFAAPTIKSEAHYNNAPITMQTQIIPVKGKLFEKQAITARMTVGRTTVTFEQRQDTVTVRMTDKGEYLGEIPFGELLQFFLTRYLNQADEPKLKDAAKRLIEYFGDDDLDNGLDEIVSEFKNTLKVI